MGDLNIYFWIAMSLLTLNAMFYTHSVMKDKTAGYKIELGVGIFSYLLFAYLMYNMSV